MPLTVLSPVKVNLRLSIGKKRPDGYHQVNTTMISLDTGDYLYFKINSAEDLVTASRQDVPGGKHNLVFSAVKLIRTKLTDIPRVNIFIEKRIPPGTGLGAGSSNAAVSLLVLNNLSSKPLPLNQLRLLSAELGSDVPFFIEGGISALRGRGDEFDQTVDDVRHEFSYFSNKIFLLIIPHRISVSTKQAYQSFDLTDNSIQDTKNVFKLDNRNYGNDFEPVVFERHFQLKYYRDKLVEKGAEVALLSGSGSALFGVFSDRLTAEQAKRSFEHEHVLTVLTTTRKAWKSWEDLIDK
ncbi:MAG: 4-(cytidine 5'-diphospho)-2-C-methyl-D-erythritol kinase [bacterium]